MKNRDTYIEVAREIGVQLWKEALWDDRRCTWLEASTELVEGEPRAVLHSSGPDLYSGTAGIALFLASLGKTLGEKTFEQCAEGAMRHALATTGRILRTCPLGLYSGAIGVAWAARRVGEVLGKEEFVCAAGDLVRSVATAEVPSGRLDVIDGAAGAILACASLYRREPSDVLMDIARRCGGVLARSAISEKAGRSWTTAGHHGRNLTGYAHGAAGIGAALIELYALTHDDAALDLALQAFEYERSCYDQQQRNWADYRTDASGGAQPSPVGFSMAWCHGAPGIALSRARAWEVANDAVALDDARRASSEIARHVAASLGRTEGNYSLCHGIAGNADVLLTIEPTATRSYGPLLVQVGTRAAEAHAKRPERWPSGVHGGEWTPGLMLGAAGTGYFYLRLADRGRWPSVLHIQ